MVMCEYIVAKFAHRHRGLTAGTTVIMIKLRNNITFFSCVPPAWEYTLFIELLRQGVIQSDMPWQGVAEVETG